MPLGPTPSEAMLLIDSLRLGIGSGFCVMIGDEHGLLNSGNVEWCKLVLALEKSSPRECRGRLVAGEWGSRPGVCMNECGSVCLGDSGTAKGAVADDVSVTFGAGSWSVNPRDSRAGRWGCCCRGVLGGRALSSRLWDRSRKVGEDGAGGSEKDRVLLLPAGIEASSIVAYFTCIIPADSGVIIANPAPGEYHVRAIRDV